jgi:hypothetical protein
MGTRSRIGVMHGDNCKSVYCHWDGYLEHNGAILQAHYDSAKANNLVALGDLSSLSEFLSAGALDHSFDKPVKDVCVFYGRDRGETGCEFKTDSTFEAFLSRVDGCCGEWYYIMKDGAWYVGNMYERDPVYYKKLVPLTEALASVLKESVEECQS